jgi:hypothetical protein
MLPPWKAPKINAEIPALQNERDVDLFRVQEKHLKNIIENS